MLFFLFILFCFQNSLYLRSIMDNKKLDIGYFISFCIEQYKNAKQISGAEASRRFSQYGVFEYLDEHYEPLHSQGSQWILEDIDEFINLRKGGKA